MPYSVELRPRARKDLKQLDRSARQSIGTAIENLAEDPRPPGVKKLQGAGPYMRLRVGDYRVLYTVDDNQRLVIVAVIGHRREIYRRI